MVKSKFIDGIYYVEAPLESSHFCIESPEEFFINSFLKEKFNIDNSILYFTKYEEEKGFPKNSYYYDNKTFYIFQNSGIKNPQGLFLTKLATEEDWKKLVEYVSSESVYRNYIGLLDDAWDCTKPSESGLSLLKAEKLDLNKNYLIVKSEDYSI